MLKCRVNLTDKVRDTPNRGNGPKPILYGATFPVNAIVIYVRPWKPPLNAITPGASGMGASNFHRVFHRFRAGSEERGFGLPAHRGKGVDFLRRVT